MALPSEARSWPLRRLKSNPKAAAVDVAAETVAAMAAVADAVVMVAAVDAAAMAAAETAVVMVAAEDVAATAAVEIVVAMAVVTEETVEVMAVAEIVAVMVVEATEVATAVVIAETVAIAVIVVTEVIAETGAAGVRAATEIEDINNTYIFPGEKPDEHSSGFSRFGGTGQQKTTPQKDRQQKKHPPQGECFYKEMEYAYLAAVALRLLILRASLLFRLAALFL